MLIYLSFSIEKCIIKIKYNYQFYQVDMQSAMGKKSSVKRILKWAFGGLSIFFIAMLFFMAFHDLMTGESSNTTEYCAKYGFLASPECW